MLENDIATQIVDAAYKTHTSLGPGLLESIYEMVLCRELAKKDLKYDRQIGVDVYHDGKLIGEGFRADIIVENKVIIEIKSVEKIIPVHLKQLRTYLRITNLKLGMLFNFNCELIKDGMHRVVNGLYDG